MAEIQPLLEKFCKPMPRLPLLPIQFYEPHVPQALQFTYYPKSQLHPHRFLSLHCSCPFTVIINIF